MKKGKTERNTRSNSIKKINPFELKFNRAKHKVLGTKTSTAYDGAPGLTKKRAHENRLETLAVEWKNRSKKNKIVDQRICEGDKSIDNDHRISKRFAAERLKLLKNNKFQLADDEEEQLTHKGMALTAVEKYDRTMMSDDEDEDGVGNIDANIVSKAHFGGGVNDSLNDSRKNALTELIAKTKQQRVEKQMAREQREDETARLDEKWRELIHAGTFADLTKPIKSDTVQGKNKGVDDYEKIFLDLRNDDGKRVEASAKQRSKDTARSVREKLLCQEEARLTKLRGNEDNVECSGFISSRKNKKEDGFEVVYDSSGALINSKKVKKGCIKYVKIDEESSDDELSEHSFDGRSFNDMLDNLDDYSKTSLAIENKGVATENITELPFIIKMPENFEQLEKLFDGSTSREYEIIIERIQKLYHPSLREGNKWRLSRLFLLCLRYCEKLSQGGGENIERIMSLIIILRKLLNYNVEFGACCLRALLRKHCKLHERDRCAVLSFEVLALLKTNLSLFVICDKFHPVITPNIAFTCRLISSVRIQSICDVARILFLIQLLEQYAGQTKRYFPEVVAFLHGVFWLGLEDAGDERLPLPTFPISLPHRRMLFIENDCSDLQSLPLDAKRVFSNKNDSFENSDFNCLGTISFAIKLLCDYGLIYSTDVNFNTMFRPFVKLLSRLPHSFYPAAMVIQISEFQSFVSAQSCRISFRQLQKPKKQKKTIEMLEPRYEENFDGGRNRSSREMAKRSKKVELKQLIKKHRRETRGTIRELRKDNRFLNREKRRETLENDRSRREKTKKLLSSLQGQESEYKKNESMKHKK